MGETLISYQVSVGEMFIRRHDCKRGMIPLKSCSYGIAVHGGGGGEGGLGAWYSFGTESIHERAITME